MIKLQAEILETPEMQIGISSESTLEKTGDEYILDNES